MIRQIIKIDEEKCNGCGACAKACHEGAIGMVGGKAKLLRDDYCDGLGNCLPVCPTGAITFEEREADNYNEDEVIKNKIAQITGEKPCGCPGTQSKTIDRNTETSDKLACGCASAESKKLNRENIAEKIENNIVENKSRLQQWPVQIKLVPVNAPYFDNANLLVAADCAAYAYGNFHERFIKNRITVIGCPKLDNVDYTEKLTAIIKNNNIKSVTVVRMEVPCCGGLENAVKQALQSSGKFIPWQVVTITSDGQILD